jgi:two-component system, CAI-1 autoinducer sensor kinase/phosphatase CqsS
MPDAIVNIFRAPMEPILHASRLRLQSLGVFVFLGQPFFGWMWLHVFPQTYENMYLRMMVGSLGLILLLKHLSDRPDSKQTEWIFSLIMWVELPLLFTALYFMNSTSPAWFGSILIMVVIYYQITDWRMATLGLISAVLMSYAFVSFFFASIAITFDVLSAQGVVLFFAWASALELAISSANQRRKRLENSLTTMGIIGHELRTPLATLSLLVDALRGAASKKTLHIDHTQIEEIVARMCALSRTMNRQIDMQIANSSLLRLSVGKEEISADSMVRSAMTQYPFKTRREQEVVDVFVLSDFDFLGSQHLFEQVILNLVKNAYRAVALTQRPFRYADVHIEVTGVGKKGFIKVFDRGVGIDRAMRNKIWDPFFSTQSDTGHGLGLAFCKAVVRSAGGKISVSSTSGTGTCFTIELPTHKPKRSWTGFHI